MKSYLISVVTNYMGLALSMAIQVFLLPFLLNHIGPRITGLYYLFMTLSNFAAIGIGWLTGAGVYLLASSESQEGAKETQEIHWVLFLGFAAYATLILLITIGGGLAAGKWWIQDADSALIRQGRNACFLLGAFIWIHYVHQADVSLLTSMLKQGWANFYRMLFQIIFILLVILFVLPAPRLDMLMLANVIGVLISAIAARCHLRISGRLAQFQWHLPRSEWVKKVFLTGGGPYFIFGIARIGLIYGDVLIIGAVLGSEMVSAYLVIWKIPDVMALLLGRISEMLNPYLTRVNTKNPKNTSALFLCTSRLQHSLGLIAGFGYAFFGSSMVSLWVGEAHTPKTPWFYWIAGVVLFIQVVNVHDVILHYALAALPQILLAQFLELFCKILLTLVLFKYLGVMAPLIAGLMIQIPVLTWVYRGSAIRQIHTKWREWVAQVGIWAVCVMIISSASGFVIQQAILKEGTVNFILSFALYTCIAFVLIVWIEYRQKDGLFTLHKILANV